MVRTWGKDFSFLDLGPFHLAERQLPEPKNENDSQAKANYLH